MSIIIYLVRSIVTRTTRMIYYLIKLILTNSFLLMTMGDQYYLLQWAIFPSRNSEP